MPLEETNCCVVAVAIQLDNDTGIVVVLTVQGSRLLGRIDINEKVSCLRPVSRLSYNRGRLAEFSGCLAVGTASGKVLLVDACLKFDENRKYQRAMKKFNYYLNRVEASVLAVVYFQPVAI